MMVSLVDVETRGIMRIAQLRFARQLGEKRLLRERSLDRSGILVLPVRIELTTSLLPREYPALM